MKHSDRIRDLRTPASYRSDITGILVLFLFWLCITASFSVRNMVMGLVFSCLVALMIRRLFGIRIPDDITPAFLLVRFPVFLAVLAWDVLKANINLAYILLRPRLRIDPAIVGFKTELKGDLKKTILANSITITPGTMTLDAQSDELLVHCLTPSQRKRLLEDRHCEHLVLRLFGESGRNRRGD